MEDSELHLESLNLTGFDNLVEFVYYLMDLATSIAVILVVFMVVMAGFKYITSSGDDAKIKSATRSLAFSILGFILVFLSPSIVEFVVSNILGAK
ncbi:hypothetical protein J6Z48_00350 [bacterium]|nr:hypothetical protein [bacterium]